jgi:hypothetical protein
MAVKSLIRSSPGRASVSLVWTCRFEAGVRPGPCVSSASGRSGSSHCRGLSGKSCSSTCPRSWNRCCETFFFSRCRCSVPKKLECHFIQSVLVCTGKAGAYLNGAPIHSAKKLSNATLSIIADYCYFESHKQDLYVECRGAFFPSAHIFD